MSSINLNTRAYSMVAVFSALMGVATFLPAGTLRFWQGWVFLGVFVLLTLAVTTDLVLRDPALLRRRMSSGPRGEARPTQKLIQAVAQLAWIGFFVLAGLDHRRGWSRMPAGCVLLGDLLNAAGYLFVWRVMRENSFASATIEVEREQRVISTGPYAVVRHPMYAGALLMLLGTPVALGSWWGLLAWPPMTGAIVWRLLDEEKMLRKQLAGYAEYAAKVRWRLVPGIF